MNALAALYGGSLHPEAFRKVFSVSGLEKCALDLALERAKRFPGVQKTVILVPETGFPGNGNPGPDLPPDTELLYPPSSGEAGFSPHGWTRRALLDALAKAGAGFDLTYYAWADSPFLDPVLSAAIAERHLRYAAEYSYADGWPYGFSPELLSPGVAGILAKIAGEDESPVERDSLFAVLGKDINAFDIETEISPVDLRSHRLNLSADSKRNLLLLTRFSSAASAGGIPAAAEAAGIIAGKPGILRTLPAFYPIQIAGGCPQPCTICPWPDLGARGGIPITERKDFFDSAQFEALLDRIAAFSGDAVIDISLWGETALHPQKMELIRMVLARPELTLLIETCGIGWKEEELEAAAALAAAVPSGAAAVRPGGSPLFWIVSLDTADPQRYRELRGPGLAEAAGCAKKLLSLFPKDAYVQAVRTAGAEDDIEKFYRSWKEAAPSGTGNIIIQKYDDFCGFRQKMQASDLSPVERQPCWHLMRDMPILLDGTVPCCREELSVFDGVKDKTLGNVFFDSLETIWSRGEKFYVQQCTLAGSKEPEYQGSCAGCDEYYTYNF
jgi:spiro-SPASM protein